MDGLKIAFPLSFGSLAFSSETWAREGWTLDTKHTLLQVEGLSPIIRSVLFMSICFACRCVAISSSIYSYVFQSWYSKAVLLIEHSSIDHCKQAKVVPQRDKGDSQEKAEAPTKFCNQRWNGVNRLFCSNSCVFRYRPKPKGDIVRLEEWRPPISNKTVFLVHARLGALCELGNVVQLEPKIVLKDFVVFPDEYISGWL